MDQVMADAMKGAFGIKPEDLIVRVSPSICRDYFGVDGEAMEESRKASGPEHREALYCQGKRPGRCQLDLWEIDEIIFREAGIRRENIHITDICAMCSSDYPFSHRKVEEERRNLAVFLCLEQREVRGGEEKRNNMDVLLEGWSPIYNVQVIMEDNGQVVRFRLWVNPGSRNTGIHNC